MADYIKCRNCESPDCKGCNLKNLETMLNSGKFDCLMDGNHCVNQFADVAPVRRGHWGSYQSDEPYGCTDDKEWYRCSECGKDAYGRCYEDEWYSAPILSAYCPHCGAKMMPQPPKGE